MKTTRSNRVNLNELVRQTPATRNRYIDLLRVLSILVVVVGHWLMAVITIDADGAIFGRNILGMVPEIQYLTWALQVMPIFFIVGGFANAASWTSARVKGTTYAVWVQGRMSRLLAPTLVFAGVWTVLTLVFAHVVNLSPATLEAGAMLVAVPVWFLGVYLLVIPMVPVMLALHERLAGLVPLALIALAAGVDTLVRDFGIGGLGYVNYVFVWAAVHQLGFFWRDGRLAGKLRQLLLAASGFSALYVLSTVGLYSRSLLGVPGETFGNTQPPTIMLMAVGLFQLGIILMLEAPTRRWLDRERVWSSVVKANALAMTVYLWHLPAMAIGVLIAQIAGLGLRGEALTASWWATRPLWVAFLTLVTIPLVMLFSKVELRLRSPRVTAGNPLTVVLGSAAAAVGLGMLALRGFYDTEGFLALTVTPLALLTIGAWLLGQLGRSLRPSRSAH